MAAESYENLNREELLAEANGRSVPYAGAMSDDELREALSAQDAADGGADAEEAADVALETEYKNPGSPTSGVPAPSDQPGRLGPADAPAPQEHLVSRIERPSDARERLASEQE